VYRKADFLRDKETLSRRLDREGSTFATSTLPAIFDGVVNILEGGAASFPGFKTRTRNGITYPVVLSGLVKCVLGHPHTEIGQRAMESLYQISYAFKKVLGPYKQDVLYKQLKEFIEVDSELKYYDYLSEPLRAITRRGREIITTVLSGLNPFDPLQAERFLPRPGPGATNTPLKKSERFVAHSDYIQISDVVDMREWYEPPFSPPRHFPVSRARVSTHYVARQHGRPASKPLEIKDAPTSRFKFVPKTNRKARGICIEENEVQWLQQGLRKALVERIESHPLTKGLVNFTSQQINGALALEGSQTGGWATLDMSSASDRISRRLVSYLFGGNKPLLDMVLACSTETIELPEIRGMNFVDELPINKIAPMGSAICFPIMALTHFALIRAILEFSTVPRDKITDVYVYGDDIIVHTDCVQAIYDYLPLYGMKFNEEKSFSRSHFRESCGLHAYEGRAVTPVRFKIARKNLRLSDLPGLLRLEEALFNKGFRCTAEYLRIQVQKCAVQHGIETFYPVPTASQLFGFYRSDSEATLDNFMQNVEGKQHKDSVDKRTGEKKPWYQCMVYKVPIVADYKVETPPLDGEPGYLRWLVTRGEKAKFVEDCPADKKFVCWTTLPESALGFRLKTEERRNARELRFARRWSGL
jgi:hypothetical protein